MVGRDELGASGVAGGDAFDDAGGQLSTGSPIAVHSCSRLGRVANPPGFSFSSWFRPGRRR